MADTVELSSHISRLERLLPQMGYAMPGHNPGVMDDAFAQAFAPAVKALQEIAEVQGEYNEGQGATIAEKMAAKKAENWGQTFDAMNSFANGQSFWAASDEKILNGLKENHFPPQLQQRENLKGVIAFMNDPSYIEDINAAYPEMQKFIAAKNAAPQPSVQPQPNVAAKPVSSQAGMVPPPDDQVQIDAATMAINRLQAYLGIQNPSHKFDEETRKKLAEKVSGFKQATGYAADKDGVYSAEFAKHIEAYVAQHKDNAEAAQFAFVMRDFLNGGGYPKGLDFTVERAAKAGAAPPPQPGQTPSGKDSAGRPLPTPAEASRFVETFLHEVMPLLEGQVGGKIAQTGFIGSMVFEKAPLPVPGAPDGKFDPDSQKALQAALKILSVPLELDDADTLYAGPATGKKIRDNVPKFLKTLPKETQEEAKKKLTPETLDLLAASLNVLRDSKDPGAQLAKTRVYEGAPFRLTGWGAEIVGHIFQWIGKIFPQAMPALNEMMRAKLGFGFNEIMPGTMRNAALDRPDLNGLSSADRLKKTFEEAFAGSKDRQVVRAALEGAMKKLGVLNIGTPEAQKSFDYAFEKAMEDVKNNKTPAEAAETFIRNKPLTGMVDEHGMPIVTRAATPQVPEIYRDLKLEGGGTIDTLTDLYMRRNQNPTVPGMKMPIVYKEGDKVKIAGLDEKTNSFYIADIKPEMMREWAATFEGPYETRAAKRAALAQKDEVYRFITGNFPSFDKYDVARDAVANARPFAAAKAVIETDIEEAKSLRAAEIARIKANEDRVAALKKSNGFTPTRALNGAEYQLTSNPRNLPERTWEIGLEKLDRAQAMGGPRMLKQFFDGGKMEFLLLDDREAFKEEQHAEVYRKSGYIPGVFSDEVTEKGFEATLNKGSHFVRVDMTGDYKKFHEGANGIDGYDKFRRDHAKEFAGKRAEFIADEYEKYYRGKGGSLERDFPCMAAGVRVIKSNYPSHVSNYLGGVARFAMFIENEAPAFDVKHSRPGADCNCGADFKKAAGEPHVPGVTPSTVEPKCAPGKNGKDTICLDGQGNTIASASPQPAAKPEKTDKSVCGTDGKNAICLDEEGSVVSSGSGEKPEKKKTADDKRNEYSATCDEITGGKDKICVTLPGVTPKAAPFQGAKP